MSARDTDPIPRGVVDDDQEADSWIFYGRVVALFAVGALATAVVTHPGANDPDRHPGYGKPDKGVVSFTIDQGTQIFLNPVDDGNRDNPANLAGITDEPYTVNIIDGIYETYSEYKGFIGVSQDSVSEITGSVTDDDEIEWVDKDNITVVQDISQG